MASKRRKDKRNTDKWRRIKSHLNDDDNRSREWKQAIADNQTPTGFGFFSMDAKDQSSDISSLGCATALAILALALGHSCLSGKGLEYRDRLLHLMLAGTICATPLFWDFMKRWWQKHAGINNRWGVYIGKNHLIYRDINEEIVISGPQIKEMKFFTAKGHKEPTSLTLWYRKVGHVTLSVLKINHNDGSQRRLIKALWAWHQELKTDKNSPQAIDQANWTLKMQEIYRFRHWLPLKVIDAIPESPCSVTDRMEFIEVIRPYQFRMRIADEVSTVLLSLFGLANICMVAAMWVALSRSERGEMWLGYFLMAWTIAPMFFYVFKLNKWRKQKRPAIIFNGLYTLYFISLLTFSGALNVLEWGAKRSIPDRSSYKYKVAFSGKYYGQTHYVCPTGEMVTWNGWDWVCADDNSRTKEDKSSDNKETVQQQTTNQTQSVPENASESLKLWAQGDFAPKEHWNKIMYRFGQIKGDFIHNNPGSISTGNDKLAGDALKKNICRQYQIQTTDSNMTIRCDDDPPIQFPLTGLKETAKTKTQGIPIQIKTRVEGTAVTRTSKAKDIVYRRKFKFTEEGVSVRYSINMKTFNESMALIIDYKRQRSTDAE